MYSGLYIRIFDASGQVRQLIYEKQLSDIQLTFFAEGGLNSAQFTVNSDFIANVDDVVRFYFRGVNFATGLVNRLPVFRDFVTTVTISGLWQSLSTQKRSLDLTTASALDVLTAIDFTGTKVIFDASKIDTPLFEFATLKVEDKTIQEIILLVVQFCNSDDGVTYIPFIDSDQKLNIVAIEDTSILRRYFEGYSAFDAEYEENADDSVNKILAFSADATETSELSIYVDTFEDAESQEIIGVYEKSIVYPATLDAGTVERLSEAYLKKFAALGRTIKAKILSEDILIRGNVAFNLRGSKGNAIAFGTNNFDDWSDGGLRYVQKSVVTSPVYLGKSSVRFVGADIVFEYSESDLISQGLYSASKVTIPIYLNDITDGFLQLQLIDAAGHAETIDLPASPSGAWILITWEKSAPVTFTVFLDNGDGTILDVETQKLGYLYADATNKLYADGPDPYALQIDGVTSITSLAKIRLVLTGTFDVVVSALAVQVSGWLTYKLPLAQSVISYTGNTFATEIQLGRKAKSLVDLISDNNDSGNLAISLLTKR